VAWFSPQMKSLVGVWLVPFRALEICLTESELLKMMEPTAPVPTNEEDGVNIVWLLC